MALRFCFQCGLDYADEVGECVECGVETVTYPPTPLHRVGGDDDPQLVYEMHSWSYEARSKAEAALHAAEIAHGWDGPSLVVLEADETAVDELLGPIDDGGAGDQSGEALDDVDLGAIDGARSDRSDVASHRAMEELFLAADTLSRNPGDVKAGEEVLDWAPQFAEFKKPFGFEDAAWGAIRTSAMALEGLVEAQGSLDDIEGEATSLANLLRSYL